MSLYYGPGVIENAVGAEEIRKAASQSTQMLLAISRTGKHLYEGTVPKAVVARRRAKNKRARAARRVNR